MNHPPSTLVDLLLMRSMDDPDRIAYSFLSEGMRRQTSISYGTLDRRARAVGRHLHALQMPGERVLLAFPAGIDFLAAFFGCLYAGAIAVPVAAPRGRRYTGRLEVVARDAGARMGLTTEALCGEFTDQTDNAAAQIDWLPVETVIDDVDGWTMPEIGPQSPAYLQYTSGSTSEPKGVVISHANVLANCAGIARAAGHTRESVLVSWLPHIHDMGLVYGLLHPLFGGFPGVIMAPAAFLQQPILWLEAMSRFAAYSSAAPNFAYALCAAKTTPEQRSTLDLSGWRVAVCGAEPIRKETLDGFSETFRPCGFSGKAFAPAYGMAEATLRITSTSPVDGECLVSLRVAAKDLLENRVVDAADGEAAQDVVGCGKADPAVIVVIADPEYRRRCASDAVGEIWVSGPSVGNGYWNRPEVTRDVFGARLASGEGPFLRTGDLGFMRDGQLFVTGRLKDLIIVRGKNYYPQDIEQAVDASHDAIRAGCSAAFAIDAAGEEQFAIVCEIERTKRKGDLDEIVTAIRQSVIDKTELEPFTISLLGPGAVPKTSSGKVQRRRCRQMQQVGELAALTTWTQPSTAADDLVARIWAEVLRVNDVGSQDNFFDLGGHSLLATQVVSRLRESFGIEIPLRALFESPTLSGLARLVDEALREGGRPLPPPITPCSREAAPPLSFAQQRLWLIDRLQPGTPAYNVPVGLRIAGPLNVGAFAQALNEIVRRHEILRTTFLIEGDGPVQVIHPFQPVPMETVSVEDLPLNLRNGRALEITREEAARPFDLVTGPLLRVSIVRLHDAEHIFVLTIHHIAGDGWSLGVFIKEIAALYAACSAGEPSPLPALAVQYADFAVWQRFWLQGEILDQQLAYWKTQLAGLPMLALPFDHPRPSVPTNRGATEPFALSPALSESLQSLSKQHGVTLFMTLLAAWQVVLSRNAGQSDVAVGTDVAGRAQRETEDLIGFFVNQLVLRTHVDETLSFSDLLKRVRETTLAAYANQDVPFDRLVDDVAPGRDSGGHPLFQVKLVLQNTPREELQLGDLTVETFDVDIPTAKLDLHLMLEYSPQNGIFGTLRYAADLFEAETARRILRQYKIMLDAAVAAPERQLMSIGLFNEGERDQIIDRWSHGDEPPERTTDQMTEEEIDRMLRELMDEGAQAVS